MDRMLYVAMSGAKQITRAQTVNTHNLANVSTDGFRAELINFQSLPLVGEGHSTRVYAQHTSEGADYTHGAIRTTGRNLDVALRGDGWFVVQGPDGNEAYTRAGNFQVSANGLMTTRSGLPVLGEAGPIALPPAQKIEIADDGTVSMQGQGQPAGAMVVVDRIRLVNPEEQDLVRGDDGLFRHKEGLVAVPDAQVRVVSGALESSNVNAVEALVTMIELSRRFEAVTKIMRRADENDAATTQMMRMMG